MKKTVILIGVLVILCLIGCRTSRVAETSTTADSSTTVTSVSQMKGFRLDSLAKLLHVELDSFVLTVENTPLWYPENKDSTASLFSQNEGQRLEANSVIGQKITLRAKRAEFSQQTDEKKCSAVVESKADSTAQQNKSASEGKSSLKQTSVAKPPDMTVVIIILIACIFVGMMIWKKLW